MRDAADVNAMLCPICKVGLAMSNREGIEIDYCPQCRGVWLDRGELDKIIERSAPEDTAPPPAQPQAPPPQPQQQQPYPQQSPWSGGGYDNRSGYDPRYPGKRKKSFLENLFD